MDGMEVPQRGRLEFTGAAVVSDDEANDTTVVTIPTLDPQGLSLLQQIGKLILTINYY